MYIERERENIEIPNTLRVSALVEARKDYGIKERVG